MFQAPSPFSLSCTESHHVRSRRFHLAEALASNVSNNSYDRYRVILAIHGRNLNGQLQHAITVIPRAQASDDIVDQPVTRNYIYCIVFYDQVKFTRDPAGV